MELPPAKKYKNCRKVNWARPETPKRRAFISALPKLLRPPRLITFVEICPVARRGGAHRQARLFTVYEPGGGGDKSL